MVHRGAIRSVRWLAVVLLAGCVGPGMDGPAEDTRTTSAGSAPEQDTQVDLGPAEDWSFAPPAFEPLPCAPDASPSGSAPLAYPFSVSVAETVRALAEVLGLHLQDAVVANGTIGIGNVTAHLPDGTIQTPEVRIWTEHEEAGQGPHLFVAMRSEPWPSLERGAADEQMDGLVSALELQNVTVVWNSERERGRSGTVIPDGIWRGTAWVGSSTFYDPPLSELGIGPWHEAGGRVNASSLASVAAEYAGCAHDAELTGTDAQRVRHESHVAEFLARQPDPGHHCGGPAWWISVDVQASTVISEHPHLCY